MAAASAMDLGERGIKTPTPESLDDLGGAGATLRFLPPYRLDFSPIEQAFAKLKALLRALRASTASPPPDHAVALLGGC